MRNSGLSKTGRCARETLHRYVGCHHAKQQSTMLEVSRSANRSKTADKSANNFFTDGLLYIFHVAECRFSEGGLVAGIGVRHEPHTCFFTAIDNINVSLFFRYELNQPKADSTDDTLFQQKSSQFNCASFRDTHLSANRSAKSGVTPSVCSQKR